MLQTVWYVAHTSPLRYAGYVLLLRCEQGWSCHSHGSLKWVAGQLTNIPGKSHRFAEFDAWNDFIATSTTAGLATQR